MFFGIDYTTTAAGTVLRFVRCEECAGAYAYRMTRKVTASQFSPYALNNRGASEGSQTEAADRLDAALANSCDPVPCPHCGRYQKAMVLRLRRIRFKWFTKLSILLLLAPLFLNLVLAVVFVQHHLVPEEVAGPLALAIAGTCWGLIPLLLGGRYVLNRRYDPNLKPVENRIALGNKLVLNYERAVDEARWLERNEE